MSFRLIQLTKHFSQKITFNAVEFENIGGFGKLTLNRPKALNALNEEMIHDLVKLLPEIQKTKAFWMEGAGGKAFCAGGDVKSIYKDMELATSFFKHEFTLDYHFSQLKSLQISNWDGVVMGGGVGISIHSPFRIATERTIFAMPENKLGFFTDVASGFVLSRMRNNLGYYLGTTGAQLKGEDVYRAGLANYYVPSASIPKIYAELESAIPSSNNPSQEIENILSKYTEVKATTPLENQEKIKELFEVGSVHDLVKKLEAKPSDPFYQEVLKTISQHSPLSVHITFQNIKRSKDRNLRDAFISDYSISEHFVKGKDFSEGVRAVLVDKGSTPTWSYKSLKDVPQSAVDAFFKPLPDAWKLDLSEKLASKETSNKH